MRVFAGSGGKVEGDSGMGVFFMNLVFQIELHEKV